MPLKLKPNTKTGELVLAWSAEDESFDASWRIKADADEGEILDVLERAIGFVRQQRGERAAKIQQIETFLKNDTIGTYLADAVHDAPAPDAERIPMGPASPNDRPSDGGPVFGWGVMASRPDIPAASANGPLAWEYIPPGE